MKRNYSNGSCLRAHYSTLSWFQERYEGNEVQIDSKAWKRILGSWKMPKHIFANCKWKTCNVPIAIKLYGYGSTYSFIMVHFLKKLIFLYLSTEGELINELACLLLFHLLIYCTTAQQFDFRACCPKISMSYLEKAQSRRVLINYLEANRKEDMLLEEAWESLTLKITPQIFLEHVLLLNWHSLMPKYMTQAHWSLTGVVQKDVTLNAQ